MNPLGFTSLNSSMATPAPLDSNQAPTTSSTPWTQPAPMTPQTPSTKSTPPMPATSSATPTPPAAKTSRSPTTPSTTTTPTTTTTTPATARASTITTKIRRPTRAVGSGQQLFIKLAPSKQSSNAVEPQARSLSLSADLDPASISVILNGAANGQGEGQGEGGPAPVLDPEKPWKHPAELDYICRDDWPQDMMITYLCQNVFSVPARDPRRQFTDITSLDKAVTVLPKGYRCPLMFVAKFQWESLRLVLTSANPDAEWNEFRFDIAHLSRLCSHLLKDAGRAAGEAPPGKPLVSLKGDRVGRLDRNWRCAMFDRALTRFYRRWMICREWSVKLFWEEFSEEEYAHDVLKHDWPRWVLRGHKGFLLTKDEVDNGIMAEQLMAGLDFVDGKWTWDNEVHMRARNPGTEANVGWALHVAVGAGAVAPGASTVEASTPATAGEGPSTATEAVGAPANETSPLDISITPPNPTATTATPTTVEPPSSCTPTPATSAGMLVEVKKELVDATLAVNENRQGAKERNEAEANQDQPCTRPVVISLEPEIEASVSVIPTMHAPPPAVDAPGHTKTKRAREEEVEEDGEAMNIDGDGAARRVSMERAAKKAKGGAGEEGDGAAQATTVATPAPTRQSAPPAGTTLTTAASSSSSSSISFSRSPSAFAPAPVFGGAVLFGGLGKTFTTTPGAGADAQVGSALVSSSAGVPLAASDTVLFPAPLDSASLASASTTVTHASSTFGTFGSAPSVSSSTSSVPGPASPPLVLGGGGSSHPLGSGPGLSCAAGIMTVSGGGLGVVGAAPSTGSIPVSRVRAHLSATQQLKVKPPAVGRRTSGIGAGVRGGAKEREREREEEGQGTEGTVPTEKDKDKESEDRASRTGTGSSVKPGDGDTSGSEMDTQAALARLRAIRPTRWPTRKKARLREGRWTGASPTLDRNEAPVGGSGRVDTSGAVEGRVEFDAGAGVNESPPPMSPPVTAPLESNSADAASSVVGASDARGDGSGLLDAQVDEVVDRAVGAVSELVVPPPSTSQAALPPHASRHVTSAPNTTAATTPPARRRPLDRETARVLESLLALLEGHQRLGQALEFNRVTAEESFEGLRKQVGELHQRVAELGTRFEGVEEGMGNVVRGGEVSGALLREVGARLEALEKGLREGVVMGEEGEGRILGRGRNEWVGKLDEVLRRLKELETDVGGVVRGMSMGAEKTAREGRGDSGETVQEKRVEKCDQLVQTEFDELGRMNARVELRKKNTPTEGRNDGLVKEPIRAIAPLSIPSSVVRQAQGQGSNASLMRQVMDVLVNMADITEYRDEQASPPSASTAVVAAAGGKGKEREQPRYAREYPTPGESLLIPTLLDEFKLMREELRENDRRGREEMATLRMLHAAEMESLRKALRSEEERRTEFQILLEGRFEDILGERERGPDRRDLNSELVELKRRLLYLESKQQRDRDREKDRDGVDSHRTHARERSSSVASSSNFDHRDTYQSHGDIAGTSNGSINGHRPRDWDQPPPLPTRHFNGFGNAARRSSLSSATPSRKPSLNGLVTLGGGSTGDEAMQVDGPPLPVKSQRKSMFRHPHE